MRLLSAPEAHIPSPDPGQPLGGPRVGGAVEALPTAKAPPVALVAAGRQQRLRRAAARRGSCWLRRARRRGRCRALDRCRSWRRDGRLLPHGTWQSPPRSTVCVRRSDAGAAGRHRCLAGGARSPPLRLRARARGRHAEPTGARGRAARPPRSVPRSPPLGRLQHAPPSRVKEEHREGATDAPAEAQQRDHGRQTRHPAASPPPSDVVEHEPCLLEGTHQAVEAGSHRWRRGPQRASRACACEQRPGAALHRAPR